MMSLACKYLSLGRLPCYNVVDKGKKCRHVHLIARFAKKKILFKLVEKQMGKMQKLMKNKKDAVEQGSYHT